MALRQCQRLDNLLWHLLELALNFLCDAVLGVLVADELALCSRLLLLSFLHEYGRDIKLSIIIAVVGLLGLLQALPALPSRLLRSVIVEE